MRKIYLLFGVIFYSSLSFPAGQKCDEIAKAITEFNTSKKGSAISHYPSPDRFQDWMRERIIRNGNLPPEVKAQLEVGADPLLVVPGALEVVENGYRRMIENTQTSVEERESSVKALKAIFDTYQKERSEVTAKLGIEPSAVETDNYVGSNFADDLDKELSNKALAEALRDLNFQMGRSLVSHFPSLDRIQDWVRGEILDIPDLHPEIRERLEKGGDAFSVMPGAVEAARDAYVRVIESSQVSSKDRYSLILALDRAVESYKKERNGFEESLDRRSPDGKKNYITDMDPAYSERLESEMRKAAIWRCVLRNVTLLSVSDSVTAVGAVWTHWKKYAGEDVGKLDGFTRASTWKNALNDKEGDFKQNLAFNTFLMLGIGASSCMKSIPYLSEDNRIMNRKTFLGAMAFTTSLAAEYYARGTWSARQLILNTLWFRYISIPKNALANQATSWWFNKGFPATAIADAFFQSISETIGAFGYPTTDTCSKHPVECAQKIQESTRAFGNKVAETFDHWFTSDAYAK